MSARVIISLDSAIEQEVALTKAVTVLGRHPDCDIVIDHPAVSGRHMLFRLVNRTVYVEDLASTNGTRVNGVTVAHQVVHHLDMIEVGRHKLHYFDDTLLGGQVKDVESTVHTDFERTLVAFAEPEPARAPEKRPARDEELSRTAYIPRDPSLRLGPAQETVQTAEGTRALALKVVAGERKGDFIPLQQANTRIGRELETALVIRRGQAYYLARFSSHRPPRLNRKELAPGAHPLSPSDLIEVGGLSFEVVQQ